VNQRTLPWYKLPAGGWIESIAGNRRDPHPRPPCKIPLPNWGKCGINFPHYAPVAQLDRVSDYESEGRRFESCLVHQKYKTFNSFELKVFFWPRDCRASTKGEASPHLDLITLRVQKARLTAEQRAYPGAGNPFSNRTPGTRTLFLPFFHPVSRGFSCFFQSEWSIMDNEPARGNLLNTDPDPETLFPQKWPAHP
jgi:hypothetical protein